MKEWVRDIAASLLMGLVVPGMLLNAAAVLAEPQQTGPSPQAAAFLPVLVREGEQVEEWDMEDYLLGVLLAEMPAWFEPEALKAQAVVARTYARKAWVTGGKHGDGSVCTDPACCQGYVSEADYLAEGGAAESVEKLRQAVLSTAGQVLTYEGELIEATYFSCSGGTTEDAVAVWGTDYPYLRSVDSPGEEAAAGYREEISFSPEEAAKRLGVELTGEPEDWIGKASYTSAGSVDAVVIGGKTFTGTQVRSLLGLRSAAFTVTAAADAIAFVTKGYGHRVGMSQYGADAMAAKGSTYEEILAHYYQGTQLRQETAEP